MKSLFVKLVVWFGTLLLLAVFAFVGTTAYLNRGDSPGRGRIDGLLRLQADEAADAWISGGPPALERYLARLDSYFHARHRLADASGRDLLSGAQLPRAAEDPGPPLLPFFRKPPFLLQRASSGGRYRLSVEAGDAHYGQPNLAPSFFAIVALILSVCYALAFTIVRPLRQLRSTLSRFGRGELGVRTRSRRHDELGDVGRAFDRMADRIQSLLTAERRLLQDISHELRSPLARLNFAVELARKSDDRDQALDRVKKETTRVCDMVNELLEMARGESECRPAEMAEFGIAEVVDTVVEDCLIEADAKCCTIVRRVEDEPAVEGDRVLLARAVENVVRNAIRYAPEGSRIEVMVRSENGDVALDIRDYGPGVPPEHLGDIFRPFFRVETDRSRASGGVGLGLAIAQRAARLHHGDIAAANASPGLRVTIRLPLCHPLHKN